MASYIRRRKFLARFLARRRQWPLAVRGAAGRADALGRRSHCHECRRRETRVAALMQRLRELGWRGAQHSIPGALAWGDAGRAGEYAAELVRLSPDVLIANGPTVLDQRETSTIPIVFGVPAPVELGCFESRAAWGMTTGSHFEFDIAGKWLGAQGSHRAFAAWLSASGTSATRLLANRRRWRGAGLEVISMGIRARD